LLSKFRNIKSSKPTEVWILLANCEETSISLTQLLTEARKITSLQLYLNLNKTTDPLLKTSKSKMSQNNDKLTSIVPTRNKNNVSWSRSVFMALKGRGVLGFIKGTKKEPTPINPEVPTEAE
jgi:gag-polypeptide of LTR copia-type